MGKQKPKTDRPRPYIPLSVRIVVADRAHEKRFGNTHWLFPAWRMTNGRYSKQCLTGILTDTFGEAPVELHHRPALINRPFNPRTGRYTPDANDPDYLVYLPKDEHRIETLVRGVGAQRSDMSQRRYNKRVARNRARGASKSLPRLRSAKRKWPKRPMQTRRKP